jgi:hypothetical protein
MILSRAQIAYLAGLAQMYGEAHVGDQDCDGSVLMGPPGDELEAVEACRWVRPNGTFDAEPLEPRPGGLAARLREEEQRRDALEGRR